MEFDLPGLEHRLPELEAGFGSIAAEYGMGWRIARAAVPKRLAIFVSKEEHCLLELHWHLRADDVQAEIGLVISNHPDLAPLVAPWGIPFHHIPLGPAAEAKAEAERRQLALLAGAGTDLVVLARYMQILSPGFIGGWRERIINIHHSFLPAFAGARPYRQAGERGVKLIGATAHYVTEDLDAGPIIEQDVERVDHRHDEADLRRIGRRIERTVLARAVAWHVEDRVLVEGNKTVVFG